MSGFQGKSISFIGAIVGIASIVSNLAVAQSQTLPPATIADNDSIYIDGKTFAITPGRAKGDTSAQIEALGSRRDYFSFGGKTLHRRRPNTCARRS